VSDIALKWDGESADLAIDANDLVSEDGLETAVLISLFTDRRAEPGDILPDAETDRRGWWGDAIPAAPGDTIGSRLWLLAREKDQQRVRTRAEEYAREALRWLIDDLVASRVDVTTEIISRGVLALGIQIQRPKVDPVSYRYNYAWAAQAAKRA
jgi:phage gp46-like protein